MWHTPCYLVFMNKMDKNNQIEKDVFDTVINDDELVKRITDG